MVFTSFFLPPFSSCQLSTAELQVPALGLLSVWRGGQITDHKPILSRRLNIRWRVHSFPVAVKTNYHQLCALEQQTFILSRFSRPDVQNQYHWAEIKVSAGPRFRWRLQGRILPASSSVWGLPAVLGSWPHHPSLCLCGHVPVPCQCQISHHLPHVRTPVVAFRVHLAYPGESPLI